MYIIFSVLSRPLKRIWKVGLLAGMSPHTFVKALVHFHHFLPGLGIHRTPTHKFVTALVHFSSLSTGHPDALLAKSWVHVNKHLSLHPRFFPCSRDVRYSSQKLHGYWWWWWSFTKILVVYLIGYLGWYLYTRIQNWVITNQRHYRDLCWAAVCHQYEIFLVE